MNDGAAAAGARAQAAVPTGAVGRSRGPAARLAKQGDARRGDLLDGEAPGLTRRAVEAALAGDMLAMKPCLERVLPRCHERPVGFSLPPLAAIGNGGIDEPSGQNVSRAMNAVTRALACGEITPGEAATIAGVYAPFVPTAVIAREKVARGNLLQNLTAGDDVEDEDEDEDDVEAGKDCDPQTGPAEGGRRGHPSKALIQPRGEILL